MVRRQQYLDPAADGRSRSRPNPAQDILAPESQQDPIAEATSLLQPIQESTKGPASRVEEQLGTYLPR